MTGKTRKKQKNLHNLLIERGYEYAGMTIRDETEITESVKDILDRIEKKEINRFLMVPYADVRNDIRRLISRKYSPGHRAMQDNTEKLCGTENLYVFYKFVNKKTNEHV